VNERELDKNAARRLTIIRHAREVGLVTGAGWSPETLGLPPTTEVASRTVKRNMTAVYRGVVWALGNSQHCQCLLCVRGCHQCSSRPHRTRTYLW